MTTSPSLSLVIPSEARHVRLAGTVLKLFCEEAGLAPEDTARVELASVEGINNAIEHAYGGRAGFEVGIQARIVGNELCIEVQDQGQALAELPSGGMPDPLMERGRGWPLMRACVDRVEYRSSGSQNVLVLIKQLPTPA